MSNEIQNHILKIKVDDETLHQVAQEKLNRRLSDEELNLAKDGLEDEISKGAASHIKCVVYSAVEKLLKKKSRDTEKTYPRYEVHRGGYNSVIGEYEMQCERSFKSEQDAREYVVLNPYREWKIIKVEKTEIYHRPHKEGEQEIPF